MVKCTHCITHDWRADDGWCVARCVRDARDVAVSQYTHTFESQHDKHAYDYCYDLNALAQYHEMCAAPCTYLHLNEAVVVGMLS